MSRVFANSLGDQNMVLESVDIEVETRLKGKQPVSSEVLVLRVRPKAGELGRCSRCLTRCPGYDGGDGERRWRTLDVGTTKAYLQAAAPRVSCPEHGVVVAHVPWARPGAKCTYLFEDTCAWLAAHAALSVVTIMLRIAWRTVADIVTRVVADGRDTNDLLAGLQRVGIDEIAYRKGHRYLTVIVDHATGRMVWAKKGRNKETLAAFFDELGAERSAALTHVSADGAEWIHTVVAARAPQALICLDPYHVVAWAMKALDKVRRRTLAAEGGSDRHAMWAVRKNPDRPHHRATRVAGEHRGHQRRPLPRLPAQRTTARGISGQGPTRAPVAGRVAVVGLALPDPGDGRRVAHHPRLQDPDRQHPRPRREQRPLRGDQHPPARTDQTRLRLPQPRSAHRDGNAHQRRPLPSTTRPKLTTSPPITPGHEAIGVTDNPDCRAASAPRRRGRLRCGVGLPPDHGPAAFTGDKIKPI